MIMVDKLLELQEEVPEVYTDQFIKGLILMMLVAGTETPCSTLEWGMSLLLNNPKEMEKIKNEINTHIRSDRFIQENDLDTKLPSKLLSMRLNAYILPYPCYST